MSMYLTLLRRPDVQELLKHAFLYVKHYGGDLKNDTCQFFIDTIKLRDSMMAIVSLHQQLSAELEQLEISQIKNLKREAEIEAEITFKCDLPLRKINSELNCRAIIYGKSMSFR